MQKSLIYTLDNWALEVVAPKLDRNLYLLDSLFWETIILFCQKEEVHNIQEVFGLPLNIITLLEKNLKPSELAQSIQLSFAPNSENIKEHINNHLAGVYESKGVDIGKEAHSKYRELVRLYCLTIHRAVMENKNSLEHLKIIFGIDEELSRYLTRLNILSIDKLANTINLKFHLRYNHSTLEALLKKVGSSHSTFFLFKRIAQSLVCNLKQKQQ